MQKQSPIFTIVVGALAIWGFITLLGYAFGWFYVIGRWIMTIITIAAVIGIIVWGMSKANQSGN